MFVCVSAIRMADGIKGWHDGEKLCELIYQMCSETCVMIKQAYPHFHTYMSRKNHIVDMEGHRNTLTTNSHTTYKIFMLLLHGIFI